MDEGFESSGADVGSDIGFDSGGDVGSDLGSDIGSDLGSDFGADLGDDLGGDLGDDLGGDLGDDLGGDLGDDLGDGSSDLSGDDLFGDTSDQSDDLSGEDGGDIFGGDLTGEDLTDTAADGYADSDDNYDSDLTGEDTADTYDAPADEEETDGSSDDEGRLDIPHGEDDADLAEDDPADAAADTDDGLSDEEETGGPDEGDDGFDIPHGEEADELAEKAEGPDEMSGEGGSDLAAEDLMPDESGPDDTREIPEEAADTFSEDADSASADTADRLTGEDLGAGGREDYGYETSPEKEPLNDPELAGERAPGGNPYAEQWENFADDVPGFGQENTDAPAGDDMDVLDRKMDEIMNSDLSNEHKRELLEDMRNYVQDQGSGEIPQTGAEQYTEYPEDDGAPVKVLKRGPGDTSISHHDPEQDLYDLDEGINNWNDVQESIARDIQNEHDSILSDTSLTPDQQADLLERNMERQNRFMDQYEREYGDLLSQRQELAGRVGRQDMPEMPDTSADLAQTAADTAGTELPRRYELPENGSMMRASDSLDMSEALGMDDPNFWGSHGRTHEEYTQLASHLPEVQQRLDSGEPLDQLMKDPEVGPTARQYYHPDNMIRVTRNPEGGYSFYDNGRHRVTAARELGCDIPVIVREK